MLSISIADLKADILPMMKGTSLRSVTDFEGVAFKASSRMLGRIDSEETRRTATISTPFYDNVNDYTCAEDYKRMIDIRPQANLRQDQAGLSDYSQTTPKQFNMRLDPNSFSIAWNSMVRTLRAQRLPAGNVSLVDGFDPTISGTSAISEGTWSPYSDVSGFYKEPLNFVQGNAALGFDLSGSTGAGGMTNSTGTTLDLSDFNQEDASMLFFYIPIGTSSRFNSFTLTLGEDGSNYISAQVTTKADGTAFSDGWNFLLFNWSTATTNGSPTRTTNVFRDLYINYDVGTAITGCLIDNWTNSFGQIYEMEYYSEYLFRTAAGAWISRPTDDTDLINVGPLSYEILKTEMMIDITQIIRTGTVRANELADWRMMLNGTSASRWVKDPPYKGLYADYQTKFPSSAIATVTRTYDFDV